MQVILFLEARGSLCCDSIQHVEQIGSIIHLVGCKVPMYLYNVYIYLFKPLFSTPTKYHWGPNSVETIPYIAKSSSMFEEQLSLRDNFLPSWNETIIKS